MKKPILLLLSFYVFGLLIEACCPKDHIEYCSSIDSTFIEVYNMAGVEPVLIDTQTVPAEGLMLRLKVEFESNLCWRRLHPAFFNTAYAFTRRCDNVYYINDTIRNIIITADEPYSALHPAGSGLNEFFKVPLFNDRRDEFNKYAYPRVDYDFWLLEPPAQAGIYTFNIMMEMTSGRIYEAFSIPVNITL